jgi:predicted SprT family Zn-dependent metalloprotease
MGWSSATTHKIKVSSKRNDPKVYGYMCPYCSKRYGEPQPLGFIDVVRCKKCPTFIRQLQIESNKREGYRKPSADIAQKTAT